MGRTILSTVLMGLQIRPGRPESRHGKSSRRHRAGRAPSGGSVFTWGTAALLAS